jgi:hypothetical protein
VAERKDEEAGKVKVAPRLQDGRQTEGREGRMDKRVAEKPKHPGEESLIAGVGPATGFVLYLHHTSVSSAH